MLIRMQAALAGVENRSVFEGILGLALVAILFFAFIGFVWFAVTGLEIIISIPMMCWEIYQYKKGKNESKIQAIEKESEQSSEESHV